MSENLKKRFIEFGITPPTSVWERITGELADEQEHILVREKISSAHIEPPASVWEDLLPFLNSSSQIRGGNKRIFQAGTIGKIAAVMAGVVLLGSVFLLVNNNPKNSLAVNTNPAVENSKKDNQPQPVPETRPPKNIIAEAAANLPKINSIYTSFKNKKKILSASKRYLYKAVVTENEELALPLVSISARPIRNEKGEIIQDSKLLSRVNDKYVSVTGPNGQQTRISAKFVNFLLYLNGDNDSEENEGVFHKSFLESLFWKSKFQSWRNTISQTAFIPSTTNFMDILEMKDLILQQNEIN